MKPEVEICRFLDAHISDVWTAITDKTWMKQWYFDLQEFKPEVGFTFEFVGGDVYKRQPIDLTVRIWIPNTYM